MSRFPVEAGSAGLRLDQFLARALSETSVHAARRRIADGQVRVDGRVGRKGDHLRAGQSVEVEGQGSGAATPEVLPDPTVVLEVLYQDSALVAVNKPAGIASHPLRPGELGTAANGLAALFPECAGASDDPREGGLGHRLDRETSGVLLAARNRAAWVALREALRDAGCEKTYVAEVAGSPPARGSFDGAIGRTGRRGARVSIDRGRQPLPAHTEWEVIAPLDGESTLVRARLHAGRAHQVRAHLAAVGHPILGDALYGDAGSRELSAARDVVTLRLHAESLTLRHPTTDQPLTIVAPLPSWADHDATVPAGSSR